MRDIKNSVKDGTTTKWLLITMRWNDNRSFVCISFTSLITDNFIGSFINKMSSNRCDYRFRPIIHSKQKWSNTRHRSGNWTMWRESKIIWLFQRRWSRASRKNARHCKVKIDLYKLLSRRHFRDRENLNPRE